MKSLDRAVKHQVAGTKESSVIVHTAELSDAGKI
jgi:hypothetical protein